jgi:hypothetical protein
MKTTEYPSSVSRVCGKIELEAASVAECHCDAKTDQHLATTVVLFWGRNFTA